MNRTFRPQGKSEQQEHMKKVEKALHRIDRAVRPPAEPQWPPKTSTALPM
jgi:hypothetical protein